MSPRVRLSDETLTALRASLRSQEERLERLQQAEMAAIAAAATIQAEREHASCSIIRLREFLAIADPALANEIPF